MQTIGGDCHTPIAAHAVIADNKIKLAGFAASPGGSKYIKKAMVGTKPFELGKNLGKKFLKLGAREMMKKLVLVTSLKAQPKAQGVKIIHLPLIKIVKPSDNYRSLDEAIKKIGQYDWIVFTSQNAVEYFMKRAKKIPTKAKIAAVGPTTAASLKKHGLKVNLVPKIYSAQGLADEFAKLDMKKKQVLFPRAKEGRETLVTELTRQGAFVDLAEAYRTLPAKIDAKKWRAYLKKKSAG